MEDDNFVLHGTPPVIPVPNESLGKFFYESLSEDSTKKDAALVRCNFITNFLS